MLLNFLTLEFRNKKLIITNHAKSRALQRARLFFSKYQCENLEQTLSRDFLSSKIDTRYINCPFYINKKHTKYGSGSFDSDSKVLTYRCILTPQNHIIICTILLKQQPL